ncbi:MAG: hypothetical protein FH761_18715 [Firmicutes bacterium]|nr:hypothetical protein [Bacillota bacterium]
MKKRIVLVSFVVSFILFVGGLYMILNSLSIGQSKGSEEIRSRGGSMDTQQYIMVIETTIKN